MNRDPEPLIEEKQPPAATQPPRSRRRLVIGLVLFAAMAAAGYYGYKRFVAPPSEATAATRPNRPGMGPMGPTPVVAVPAGTADLDVYLGAIGTVTPLRTVTVKSRVEGQLLRVHFQEGQLVKEGQLLAEIDPRPFEVQLMQAEGQMARDRALLENARLDYERYRMLFQQDSIAKQQVDTQAALVRQYEGAVKIDQSAVDNARLQLTYARITAPISGRAGLRQVDPGNMISAGADTGLVVLTQLQPITVVFPIPQDNLPAVMKQVQAGARLVVEAWDREQKNKLAGGTLLSVDNLIDPATGTIKLKAQFANDDSALFPNQFVNVRMRLDTLRDAIVIPSAAIQRGAQGMFVYVVKDDQTVSPRLVKLGPTEGQRVAVTEGIQPGELVVIDGTDRLRDGAKVELAERPELKQSIDGKNAPPQGARRGGPRGPGGAGGAPQR